MDFWDKYLPEKVFRIQYESLVNETSLVLEKLFYFLKLPFESDCLNFYLTKRAVVTASSQQVRSPITTKHLAQWKNYEKYLTPLKMSLGEQTLARFELFN